MTAADAPDWTVPDAWLAETANAAQVAASLREEAAMFASRYYERREMGAPAGELRALEISRWHCIEHAAEIERRLRGIA